MGRERNDPPPVGAATGRAGEAAPDACDVDLGVAGDVEAVWLAFQREREASCPVTGARIHLALLHDPAEAGGGPPEVWVWCEGCGQRASFSPPDAAEAFGWAE